jgi:hypothetical protein
MKIRTWSVFILVFALFGCAQQPAPVPIEKVIVKPPFSANGERIDTTEEVAKTGQLLPVVAQEVNYIENNHEVKGYLAQPDFIGSSPATILVPQWWGITEAVKTEAQELAKQGHTVLVLDFYNGESTTDPVKAKELAQKVQTNLEKAHENLFWAKRYLQQMMRVDEDKLILSGWCFGEATAPDGASTTAWAEGQPCGTDTTIQIQ